MEWYLALLFLLSGLVVLMLIGLPVAFSFLIISMVWMFFLWGGEAGLEQLVVSVFESLTRFGFVAIPLFILMGEVMFQSGIAPRMIESLDKWLGRLPGRLGLLAVGSGSIFATLTGVSLASVALMGSTLTPEMEKRGYKKSMSLGPILGSGGLAIMIPPSQIAVFLAVIAVISVGKTLIAIIVPGVLMAVLYAVYIIVRCHLQPSIAPAYEVPHIPLSVKLVATAKYILPLGFIILMVTGVIFLGIATPSEAAATGALSCFILAAAYRRLSWEVVTKQFPKTPKKPGMK